MSFRSFSVQGATIRGVEAVPVSVEIVISNGLPGFAIVGMADAAIQESRERVKAALRSSGFVMPNEKIVVNLAPGALRKTGRGLTCPSLSVFWLQRGKWIPKWCAMPWWLASFPWEAVCVARRACWRINAVQQGSG